MTVSLDQATGDDRDAWLTMRLAMWPDSTREQHLDEIDDVLGSDDCWAVLARAADGRPAGFAEFSLRKYANGCTGRPVPFLEGIWVEPDHRRDGVGTALIAHVEGFFAARGFQELCSDALADNTVSRTAHRQWGFAETESVVYFRKPLDAGRG